jgi:endoglucanase
MKFSPYLRAFCLVFLLLWANISRAQHALIHGGIVRGDLAKREIALAFTGHEFAEGGEVILRTLRNEKVKASFFFTGDFYRNPSFKALIRKLKAEKHYLGAHSDKHLLYCDWVKRDSLLVSRSEFLTDLKANYREMETFGIRKKEAFYFLPPFEWYNDSISLWTDQEGLKLINFTSGTRSNADYTTPGMKNYRSSQEIYKSIMDYETKEKDGLNGFILLVHIGVSPARTDKFYQYLKPLIKELKAKNYTFVRIDQLLR